MYYAEYLAEYLSCTLEVQKYKPVISEKWEDLTNIEEDPDNSWAQENTPEEVAA